MLKPIHATFDGQVLRPDNPLPFPANTRIILTMQVVQSPGDNGGSAWLGQGRFFKFFEAATNGLVAESGSGRRKLGRTAWVSFLEAASESYGVGETLDAVLSEIDQEAKDFRAAAMRRASGIPELKGMNTNDIRSGGIVTGEAAYIKYLLNSSYDLVTRGKPLVKAYYKSLEFRENAQSYLGDPDATDASLLASARRAIKSTGGPNGRESAT